MSGLLLPAKLAMKMLLLGWAMLCCLRGILLKDGFAFGMIVFLRYAYYPTWRLLFASSYDKALASCENTIS